MFFYVPKRCFAGELLVAASYNSKHSVLASYWPGFGELIETFDTSLKRIGTILFFLKHSVILKKEGSNSDSEIRKTRFLPCEMASIPLMPFTLWFISNSMHTAGRG